MSHGCKKKSDSLLKPDALFKKAVGRMKRLARVGVGCKQDSLCKRYGWLGMEVLCATQCA